MNKKNLILKGIMLFYLVFLIVCLCGMCGKFTYACMLWSMFEGMMGSYIMILPLICLLFIISLSVLLRFTPVNVDSFRKDTVSVNGEKKKNFQNASIRQRSKPKKAKHNSFIQGHSKINSDKENISDLSMEELQYTQTLTKTPNDFDDYFNNKIYIISDPSKTKEKIVNNNVEGEDFNTYFGEGQNSIKIMSETRKSNGFDHYFHSNK
ncbi:MAG: hypothetical protein WCR27_06525 [Eubacteriales bacterium]